MNEGWTTKDYTYVVVFATLLFISSAVFGALAFLYSTPFFFVADFAYAFPHALLLTICYLLIRKFPIWTYVSSVEGIISCLALGWNLMWLPLYVLQGLIPDIYLKYTKGYENTKLRHSIIAALIYETVALTITWPIFLYVFRLHYPTWIVMGSIISGYVWIIIGAVTGYRLTPQVKVALKAY